MWCAKLIKRTEIESPCYWLEGRDFVHQGKIEIDVNERAVTCKLKLLFRLHQLRLFP